jgi:ribosomal protein S18 acetylase RimI-like enzyme
VPDKIGHGFFVKLMNIRKAERRDLPTIMRLMREFAEFENLLEYFETTKDRMSAAMFERDAFVEGLVADLDGHLVAYAIFYRNFATFRGQQGIYLEDIYVSPKYQGKGIGEAMLRQVAVIGKSRGCERIDFQVLEWNASAIGFYERLGAQRDDRERHFKFTDDAFRRLAE